MIAIVATATCRECEWSAEGDWVSVDRGAERHMRQAKHTTTTHARPAQNGQRGTSTTRQVHDARVPGAVGQQRT